MKFIDEYRDGEAAKKLATAIHEELQAPCTIMEVCGGQTHSIVRFGVDELLPTDITLVHGPGCPVCVTPQRVIDQALLVAAAPNVIFCSFGDMLRVPGTKNDLFTVRATGGEVRIVYSPLDAVKIARENPTKEVVFFAVGFETTAPTTAMAVYQASREGLSNFSVLISHVRVPPAMETILSSPENKVQAFLAAGHVCTIMGIAEYQPIAERYRVPIVVTGFEPLDLLEGIYLCVKQLAHGDVSVQNQYARSVRSAGNQKAQELLDEVFEVCNLEWRGLGEIQESGLKLRAPYQPFDAASRFELDDVQAEENSECISGLILQGLKKPADCPAFGGRCTPEHPLGATMVSSEGTCAAYYRYRAYARNLQ